MRALAFPLRIDGSGSFATVPQGSDAEAAQVARMVLSTVTGERPLAPDFGITDPSGVGVSADGLAAAVEMAEPDLQVVSVDVDQDAGGSQSVAVTVAWREEA